MVVLSALLRGACSQPSSSTSPSSRAAATTTGRGEGEMDILFGILLVLLLAALIAYSVRD